MAYIKKDKSNKPALRNGRVVYYLTQEDHHALTQMAEKLGLTRCSLTTSIVERLLIGGFSPIVGAKLCDQIQKLHQNRGHTASFLYFGIRPLPPLAEEEISKSETKSLLNQIKKELKLC